LGLTPFGKRTVEQGLPALVRSLSKLVCVGKQYHRGHYQERARGLLLLAAALGSAGVKVAGQEASVASSTRGDEDAQVRAVECSLELRRVEDGKSQKRHEAESNTVAMLPCSAAVGVAMSLSAGALTLPVGGTTKRAGNAKAMADISNRCLSDLPVSQFSHSTRNAC
jgi:hypothetical protein